MLPRRARLGHAEQLGGTVNLLLPRQGGRVCFMSATVQVMEDLNQAGMPTGLPTLQMGRGFFARGGVRSSS